MSTVQLNLDFAPGVEPRPTRISVRRRRFLRRRARLRHRAQLRKGRAEGSRDGRPLLTGPAARGPPCYSNGLPAGMGSRESQQGGRDYQQGGRASQQDSKPRDFAPCPPSADALLLSECQSALPPLGAAPTTHRGPPPRCRRPPPSSTSSSQGRPAPPRPTSKPYKCVALDCEMVGTKGAGKWGELARCSIVSYHGDLIYDRYVRPVHPITDYRTRWSGIRRHHMLQATPFKQARREIVKILHGKIIVGHAVHNDFKALMYTHPRSMTRDTSRMPVLNLKAGFSEKETVSLKRLTKALFDKDIQVGKAGHSSIEDAHATMDLYRLVETQVEQEQVEASPQE